MREIKKVIKKRSRYKEKFSKGFVHYCIKGEDDYNIPLIMEVVAEIKKDFPSVEDGHIAIKSFTPNDELELYFYCMEIPNDMQFDEEVDSYENFKCSKTQLT